MKSKRKASTAVRRIPAEYLTRGTGYSFDKVRNAVLRLRLASYSTHQYLESSVFPAVGAAMEIHQEVADSLLATLHGDQPVREFVRGTSTRAKSAVRFKKLVRSYGRELFGSATYPGQTILAESQYLRLRFLPPKKGVRQQRASLFHAGGGIPYGDRIFRALPEANFFDRFLERGIPVYAMELLGDTHEIDYSDLDLETIIDSIDEMSDIAFEHNGGDKLILEGYCGHGMQTLSYLAARPQEADRKFSTLCLFVAPIDGRECRDLGALLQLAPRPMLDRRLSRWALQSGYAPGDSMRVSIDLTLKLLFQKTAFGQIYAGWRSGDYAGVRRIQDLTPLQRKHLATSYWLSPECAIRFQLPVSLVRFATDLFTKGIGRKGSIPFVYRGRPLSLAQIVEQTTIRVIGFYGGMDTMVPNSTAHPLVSAFGSRYQHVVHLNAGHVSYVLSPKSWSVGNPMGLVPNPIDLMLEDGA